MRAGDEKHRNKNVWPYVIFQSSRIAAMIRPNGPYQVGAIVLKRVGQQLRRVEVICAYDMVLLEEWCAQPHNDVVRQATIRVLLASIHFKIE